MNLTRKSSLLMLLIIFLFATPSVDAQKLDQSAKVRGRVVRKGNSRNYPVTHVRVTLALRATRERRSSVYTGSDGMFYFLVRSGSYILEVWNGENKSIASYYIQVDKPNVDVEIAIP